MEFTAFGTTIGYFLAGSVPTDDLEEAFQLVAERVRSGLSTEVRETGIEILLRTPGGQLERRMIVLGKTTRHGTANCGGPGTA